MEFVQQDSDDEELLLFSFPILWPPSTNILSCRIYFVYFYVSCLGDDKLLLSIFSIFIYNFMIGLMP